MKETKSTKQSASNKAKARAKATQLVKELQEGKYKSVVFMVGAGISTAAGIPDFRTPGTGLYSNLEKLNLPYPEAVFDIDYLRKHPEAFYTLAKGLYPSQFKPTPFHQFIKYVHDLGCLKRVYTQNIDCLERQAGVPGELIVEAHGSFAKNHCLDCKAEAVKEKVEKLVLESKDIAIPKCHKCGGIVKPDIVFFGEALPTLFFDSIDDDFNHADIDLVIVGGTSLQVQPFAQLPDMVSKSVPRVLFNMERVGTLGSRKEDTLILGPLEDIHGILAPDTAKSESESESESGRNVENSEESKSKESKSTQDLEDSKGTKKSDDQLKANEKAGTAIKATSSNDDNAKQDSENDESLEKLVGKLNL